MLRPEPGNARTAVAIEAMGREAIRLPLFAVAALPWDVPDSDGFDALLLTSANAVRHGGASLQRLRALPVLAVGDATASAARAAGFVVAETGEGGVSALSTRVGNRLLHLAGREHVGVRGTTTIAVYAADALPIARSAVTSLEGCIALLHSVRAARAFASLPLHRSTIAVAALSEAVAAAAGSGWGAVVSARMPRDETLLEAAAALPD